jgi:hypothetical protein
MPLGLIYKIEYTWLMTRKTITLAFSFYLARMP